MLTVRGEDGMDTTGDKASNGSSGMVSCEQWDLVGFGGEKLLNAELVDRRLVVLGVPCDLCLGRCLEGGSLMLLLPDRRSEMSECRLDRR